MLHDHGQKYSVQQLGHTKRQTINNRYKTVDSSVTRTCILSRWKPSYISNVFAFPDDDSTGGSERGEDKGETVVKEDQEEEFEFEIIGSNESIE